MRATIRKEFSFEAAHRLPGHDSACAQLHGHSYKVEVFVSGEVNDEFTSPEGMVMDFGDLSEAVKRVIAKLDHRDLNTILPVRTTAENIAAWICRRLYLKHEVPVTKVRVWETAKCWAEVEEHQTKAYYHLTREEVLERKARS